MSCSILREKRQQYFSQWKFCLFFQKILFSTTSQVLKECSHKFHSSCHNSFWTPISCFLRFVTLDKTRRNRRQYFFRWNDSFFQKLVFSTTSEVLKKCSYEFYNDCQNTCLTLKNCPVRFVTLDNTRKNRRQHFFAEKVAFFSKKCVFNNSLGSKKTLP